MRGGYDNTALALQLPYCEAQFGRRTERIEQIYAEPVRGENIGRPFGEKARIVTAVVSHGNAYLLARKTLFKVVCQALRSHAYRVLVHAVRTHAHNAAQAARTEFEVFVETLGQLLFVVVNQILDLFLCSFIVIAVEPFLGFGHYQLIQIVVHSYINFAYTVTKVFSENIIHKDTQKISNIQYQVIK